MLGHPMQREWATRLAGRGKRELIQTMLVRSPHVGATEKLMLALEAYPLSYLLMASEYPTRIWILDRDEKLSSAAILTEEMRGRRWHSTRITIDECDGLTDVALGYVAMVTSWRSMLVMRHEFAHVATTFFAPRERAELGALYLQAQRTNHFLEPLARESIGEYLACALSAWFFEDLAKELASFDPLLFRFVRGLMRRAEGLSRSIEREASLAVN